MEQIEGEKRERGLTLQVLFIHRKEMMERDGYQSSLEHGRCEQSWEVPHAGGTNRLYRTKYMLYDDRWAPDMRPREHGETVRSRIEKLR